MSRLLFAAARGARVEMLQCPGEWVDTGSVPLDPFNTLFMHRRIHPDDEHLQYGPVSTELRENATGDDPPRTAFSFLYGSFWMRMDDTLAVEYCGSELHRSLFLLILSESLADEGL